MSRTDSYVRFRPAFSRHLKATTAKSGKRRRFVPALDKRPFDFSSVGSSGVVVAASGTSRKAPGPALSRWTVDQAPPAALLCARRSSCTRRTARCTGREGTPSARKRRFRRNALHDRPWRVWDRRKDRRGPAPRHPRVPSPSFRGACPSRPRVPRRARARRTTRENRGRADDRGRETLPAPRPPRTVPTVLPRHARHRARPRDAAREDARDARREREREARARARGAPPPAHRGGHESRTPDRPPCARTTVAPSEIDIGTPMVLFGEEHQPAIFFGGSMQLGKKTENRMRFSQDRPNANEGLSNNFATDSMNIPTQCRLGRFGRRRSTRASTLTRADRHARRHNSPSSHRV